MSRAESLSLELESARLALERLKAENAKLRAAKEIEVTAPSDETEQLYQQAVSDLAQKDEIARLRGNLDAAKEEHRQLSVEMKAVKDQAELELHCALAKERERWEQREERLVKQLLSDRGAAFLSGLMQELYHLLGIHKVNTTAYHHQTDGLVERFH